MKHIITLSAVAALLAIVSSGCSDLNSPLGPSEISAVSFPSDGSEGSDIFTGPEAPSNLEAFQEGSYAKLNWEYGDLRGGWFRVYVVRAPGSIKLLRVTQDTKCTVAVGSDWTKLIFRVTALDAQGNESVFSASAAIYQTHPENVPHYNIPDEDAGN